MSIWTSLDHDLYVPERDDFTLEPRDAGDMLIDVATSVTRHDGIRLIVGGGRAILLPEEVVQLIESLRAALDQQAAWAERCRREGE